MFSINPAYDYQKEGDYAIGGVNERQNLYRRCESEGVGISVMKAFSGGQLLNAKTSPFGKALTEYQCIQYALDKPGVITVLPGVKLSGFKTYLGDLLMLYQKEKDYSILEHASRKQKAHVCIAITASHVLPDWMWGLLINIMILHWLEMIWLKAIMQVLIKKSEKIAYNASPFHVSQVEDGKDQRVFWRMIRHSTPKGTELTVCSVPLRRGACCRFRNDSHGPSRYSFCYFLHYRLHCPIIG